jgi:hypothetical protein
MGVDNCSWLGSYGCKYEDRYFPVDYINICVCSLIVRE